MPRPRTQLQENRFQQLVGTLEDLADFDAQRRYKRSVPFVHVPIELAEQWYGYVRLLDGRVEWFLELFAPNELAAIRKFDLLFQKIDMGGGFPDVEEVFKREDWVAVSAAAKILLSVLTRQN